MRKVRYYIKPLQVTGRKLPVTSYVALWLLCDKFNIPPWLWGVYWTLAAILFILFIVDLVKTEEKMVDIQALLKAMDDKQKNETV